MWTCHNCGERIETQFDSCWKCATPRAGTAADVAQGKGGEAAASQRRLGYRVFRGTWATWDDLFHQAAAFANEVGPERVLSISHSCDHGDGVVTVWYWRPRPSRVRSESHPSSPIEFMAEHKATVSWQRAGPDFLKGQYSREHTWTFDGGVTVPASPAPSVVPAPWSNPANVDPEEAFVAAISSCHMLTFLFLASQQGFQVESYRDAATGRMMKNERGVPWVSTVTLHPQVIWSGAKRPAADDEARLHQLAHEQCFIANSVKTEVIIHRAGGGP